MRLSLTAAACLALAACASSPPMSSASLRPSPECEAARLKPPEPLAAGSIPDDVLRQARSGWVAVRYDVVGGKARNVAVVASDPPGLYDPYVLRHASAYVEPSGATVVGCLATTTIRF